MGWACSPPSGIRRDCWPGWREGIPTWCWPTDWSSCPTRQAWRRRLWRALARRVLRDADLVIANSAYTAKLTRALTRRARVAYIPLGVDAGHFAPRESREDAKRALGLAGKTVVSTVARLSAYKGIDVVLRALAALSAEERRNLIYLVAGDGEELGRLQALAQELGVAEMVRWCGVLGNQELPRLYGASDLFVLCARESERTQSVEGFGLVFLEAQACATPVVGTRTGGIPDAIREGEGGWLLAQDDSEALGEILRRLLREPASFHAEGLRARQRVLREATWEHYMEKLLAMLALLGTKHE